MIYSDSKWNVAKCQIPTVLFFSSMSDIFFLFHRLSLLLILMLLFFICFFSMFSFWWMNWYPGIILGTKQKSIFIIIFLLQTGFHLISFTGQEWNGFFIRACFKQAVLWFYDTHIEKYWVISISVFFICTNRFIWSLVFPR